MFKTLDTTEIAIARGSRALKDNIVFVSSAGKTATAEAHGRGAGKACDNSALSDTNVYGARTDEEINAWTLVFPHRRCLTATNEDSPNIIIIHNNNYYYWKASKVNATTANATTATTANAESARDGSKALATADTVTASARSWRADAVTASAKSATANTATALETRRDSDTKNGARNGPSAVASTASTTATANAATSARESNIDINNINNNDGEATMLTPHAAAVKLEKSVENAKALTATATPAPAKAAALAKSVALAKARTSTATAMTGVEIMQARKDAKAKTVELAHTVQARDAPAIGLAAVEHATVTARIANDKSACGSHINNINNTIGTTTRVYEATAASAGKARTSKTATAASAGKKRNSETAAVNVATVDAATGADVEASLTTEPRTDEGAYPNNKNNDNATSGGEREIVILRLLLGRLAIPILNHCNNHKL